MINIHYTTHTIHHTKAHNKIEDTRYSHKSTYLKILSKKQQIHIHTQIQSHTV